MTYCLFLRYLFDFAVGLFLGWLSFKHMINPWLRRRRQEKP